jgi:hypothetical protein
VSIVQGSETLIHEITRSGVGKRYESLDASTLVIGNDHNPAHSLGMAANGQTRLANARFEQYLSNSKRLEQHTQAIRFHFASCLDTL